MAIVISATTPSNETIKSPKKPEVPVIGYQCHRGDHGPLSHTVSHLDGRDKDRIGYNIILPPGQRYPGRGGSVISRSIPACTSTTTPWSYSELLPYQWTCQPPGTRRYQWIGHYLSGSSILSHSPSGPPNITGGQGSLLVRAWGGRGVGGLEHTEGQKMVNIER